ncbi:MAG: nuclear transport factor 2 family protein [Betaproteobacteria bacterium]|nr:nuclear transport factor 2 family protein [Betaproteobacteria bacterium]
MTKYKRTLLKAGLGVSLLLGLGLSKAAAESNDDAAKVIASVEAFRLAMLKGDGGALEQLCADQMSYGHSAGRIETKAQFIAASTSGKSTWSFINLTEQSVNIVGDSAIARHVLSGETLSDGKTTAIKIGILMVWQRQSGAWRLLARQAYRI